MSDETVEQEAPAEQQGPAEQALNLPPLPADIEERFKVKQEYMDTIVSHAHKTFNNPANLDTRKEATGLVCILYTEDELGASIQLGTNIKDDKILYVLQSVVERLTSNG